MDPYNGACYTLTDLSDYLLRGFFLEIPSPGRHDLKSDRRLTSALLLQRFNRRGRDYFRSGWSLVCRNFPEDLVSYRLFCSHWSRAYARVRSVRRSRVLVFVRNPTAREIRAVRRVAAE